MQGAQGRGLGGVWAMHRKAYGPEGGVIEGNTTADALMVDHGALIPIDIRLSCDTIGPKQ